MVYMQNDTIFTSILITSTSHNKGIMNLEGSESMWANPPNQDIHSNKVHWTYAIWV